MRKIIAGSICAAALLAAMPAQAGHKLTAEYVAPATNGFFYQRNIPNPAYALGEVGYGYGGYTFAAPGHEVAWVRITDVVAGRAQVPYTICSPNCDGFRVEGCTPGTGKVKFTPKLPGDQPILVYVHAYDPVFRGCEGNTASGTIELKTV